MTDEAEEPKIGSGELPPKIKAKDNPWYLLATLYGEPTPEDDELQARNRRARNRTAWNRYMAGALTEESRALLRQKGHPAEELTPLADEELCKLACAFEERHQKADSAAPKVIPKLGEIDFSNVDFDFDRPFFFGGLIFPLVSRFRGATFSGWADFEGATFSGETTFEGATFSEEASFEGATFSGWADFKVATFSKWAGFDGATFSKADFEGAIFKGRATFVGATFSEWAGFKGATFSEEAAFAGTIFSEGATFVGADFERRATFVNAEMKGPTSFEAAQFRSEPPRFFGAKLHEGTVWRDISWPLPKERDEAGQFIDAYERLKLEMDRLKKHEDELNFFALELQSKRVYHRHWKPVFELKVFGRTIPVSPLKIPNIALSSKRRTLFGRTFALPPINIPPRTITLYCPAPGLPIALYGLLCDYGRSYARPLLGLAITAIAGAPLFWASLGWCHLGQALALSLANTFGVLGFRKDLIDPDLIKQLPGSLVMVGAVQTVVGIVLLFLFGLAIRNRFRIK